MMYAKTTYVAGDTIDVQYTIPRRCVPMASRGARESKTSDAVQKYNLKMAERRLTRILNENFRAGDIHLVLTYAKNSRPETSEQAKKHIRLFNRKLRGYFKRQGRELKYLYTTAYGTRGAIHHHIVISTMDVREIRAMWPYGGSHAEIMYGNDFSKLAAYIVKQSKMGLSDAEKLSGKKWSGSRNLVIPEPRRKISQAKRWRDPPKPIRGYYIDLESVESGVSPVTGMPYLFYRMIKLKTGGNQKYEYTIRQ